MRRLPIPQKLPSIAHGLPEQIVRRLLVVEDDQSHLQDAHGVDAAICVLVFEPVLILRHTMGGKSLTFPRRGMPHSGLAVEFLAVSVRARCELLLWRGAAARTPRTPF